MIKVPHFIPYQGSKRKLAGVICQYLPEKIGTFYEPFVGSGAMSLAIAAKGRAERLVLGDSYKPLVSLWEELLRSPESLAEGYRTLWLDGD